MTRTNRVDMTAVSRVVVKVGSSSLTTAEGGLDADRLRGLVEPLARLRRGGAEVVLVSSGAIAAVLVSPFTLASGGAIATPSVLGVGLLVALAGIVVPTALEMEALRRMRAGTVAVLLSLEPAIAAAVGFALLGQRLTLAETAGAVLVVLASVGALSGGAARGPTG